MNTIERSLPDVLCCICGQTMKPNQANTCAACLQARFDITKPLTKSNVLLRCKGCGRFQRDTSGWIECELESKELLALCLKKVAGLKQVKLTDACFLWTEPHSKRIKVRLTVQGQVVNGVILQESCVVEFALQNRMCLDCHRIEAKKTWSTVVQVRQKVTHKRTFLYLEQLILKHEEHERTLKIETMPDGVDFYFGARNDAIRFVSFLESVVPIRYKTSKHLVTSDAKSNTALFNHTFSVELVPVCKDDLLCLPKQLANKLGAISQFVLCTNVNSVMKLIDPCSCQIAELSAERFWQNRFKPLASAHDCIEFIVLDVQPTGEGRDAVNHTTNIKISAGKRKIQVHDRRQLKNYSKSHSLAFVEVARLNDFGVNDERTIVKSHLGNILKPNDIVLGYDLKRSNSIETDNIDLHKKAEIPEIVLVKKHYPIWRKSQKCRSWKIKSLGIGAKVHGSDKIYKNPEQDVELFMRDVEEDENMQERINLYRNDKLDGANEIVSEVEDDIPQIKMDSLLEDFEDAANISSC